MLRPVILTPWAGLDLPVEPAQGVVATSHNRVPKRVAWFINFSSICIQCSGEVAGQGTAESQFCNSRDGDDISPDLCWLRQLVPRRMTALDFANLGLVLVLWLSVTAPLAWCRHPALLFREPEGSAIKINQVRMVFESCRGSKENFYRNGWAHNIWHSLFLHHNPSHVLHGIQITSHHHVTTQKKHKLPNPKIKWTKILTELQTSDIRVLLQLDMTCGGERGCFAYINTFRV